MSAILGGGDRARLDIHMDAIRSWSAWARHGIPARARSAPACKKPRRRALGGGLRRDRQGAHGPADAGAGLRSHPGGVAAVARSVTAFTWVNVSGEHHGCRTRPAAPAPTLPDPDRHLAHPAVRLPPGPAEGVRRRRRRQPAGQHPVLLAQRAGHRPAQLHARAHRHRHRRLQAAAGQDAGHRALPQVPGRHHRQRAAHPPRAHDRAADHQLRRRAVAPRAAAQPAVTSQISGHRGCP